METHKREQIMALETDLERVKIENRYLANEINMNTENYNEFGKLKNKEGLLEALQSEAIELKSEYQKNIFEFKEPTSAVSKLRIMDSNVDLKTTLKKTKELINEFEELSKEKTKLEEIQKMNENKKGREMDDFYTKQQMTLIRQNQYKKELDELTKELDDLIAQENKLQGEIQSKTAEIAKNEQGVKSRMTNNKMIYDKSLENNQNMIRTLKKKLNDLDSDTEYKTE